ncbi:hypothetical protein [Halomontanus rarus]|uniref:hypothetical protein n=1 Tax=Halomontanus rarus TaxID=3034020 RepID=UPI0023E86B70|nr:MULTISPECIES: hypothetical protein [unclassified Halovivax]
MNRGFYKGMLIACLLMMVALVASVPYTESGSPTYVAIQIAAVHLVVAMLVLGSFLHFDWNPIRRVFE